MAAGTGAERSVEQFADSAAFVAWLRSNHDTHPGIWMRIAKKAAPVATISYPDAVDAALAWGWIDGQRRPLDEHFFLQGFTRRAPRSVWSRRNADRVRALEEAGAMSPAGLREVAAARADGRWDSAYEGAATATAPDDFLAELRAVPEAAAFYETISAANRYAIYWRVTQAKRPETRARRISLFVDMLARGETLH